MKHQSIIVYVPGKSNTPSFDDVFLACSAGYGINMGTGTYPTSGAVGKYGLCEPTGWKNGGHSMSFVAVAEEGSEQFIYLCNSHAWKYAGDKYFPGKQPGVWINRTNFWRIANGAYRYGNWYVNIGEMV